VRQFIDAFETPITAKASQALYTDSRWDDCTRQDASTVLMPLPLQLKRAKSPKGDDAKSTV